MATYYVDSNATGDGSGSSWANAAPSLYALVSSATTITGGDVIYVAHNHNAININPTAGLYVPEGTITTGFVKVLSVTSGTTTLQAGAKESYITTAAQFGGQGYFYGIEFASSLNSAGALRPNFNSAGICVFDNCKFTLTATGISATILLGNNAAASTALKFLNCIFSFGNVSQKIEMRYEKFEFVNCSLAGVAPTTLIVPNTSSSNVTISGCDFSTPTNLIDMSTARQGRYLISNSKIPANIRTGTTGSTIQVPITVECCNYTYEHQDVANKPTAFSVIQNTGVYLTTGGATLPDAAGANTKLSLQLTTNTETTDIYPANFPVLNVFCGSTGTKTISVKVAHTLASALKDNEIWLEVDTMSDASSHKTTTTLSAPVVIGTSSRDINATGTSLTNTAEGWTGLTTPKTHTLSEIVSIQKVGFIKIKVCLAVASAIVYLDPKVSIAEYIPPEYSATTWSTIGNTNITLSNANKKATANTFGAWALVRSNLEITTPIYVEVTVNPFSDIYNSGIGLKLSTDSFSYPPSGNGIYQFLGYGNRIYGISFNPTTGSYQIRENNTLVMSGTLTPNVNWRICGWIGNQSYIGEATINAGELGFTYTPVYI